jgi:hypothetical protein
MSTRSRADASATAGAADVEGTELTAEGVTATLVTAVAVAEETEEAAAGAADLGDAVTAADLTAESGAATVTVAMVEAVEEEAVAVVGAVEEEEAANAAGPDLALTDLTGEGGGDGGEEAVPVDAAALVVELAVLVNAAVADAAIADAAVADAVDANPPSPEAVNPPPAVILFSIRGEARLTSTMVHQSVCCSLHIGF